MLGITLFMKPAQLLSFLGQSLMHILEDLSTLIYNPADQIQQVKLKILHNLAYLLTIFFSLSS